jgi:hypothetical protein
LFQSGGGDGTMNTVGAKWSAEELQGALRFRERGSRTVPSSRSKLDTRARWRHPGDRRAGPRRGSRISSTGATTIAGGSARPGARLFVVKRGSGIEALTKRIH